MSSVNSTFEPSTPNWISGSYSGSCARGEEKKKTYSESNQNGRVNIAAAQFSPKEGSWISNLSVNLNPITSPDQQQIQESQNSPVSYAPVFSVKSPRAYTEREPTDSAFRCLQKLDGIILGRKDNSIFARFRENESDQNAIEVEFDLNELPDSDQEIANEGSPLVWTIGYSIERGTKKRQSILYVRRISPPSGKEMEQSRNAVSETMSSIQWE